MISVRDRILEAASKEPAPSRERVRAQRRLVLAIGAAVSLAAFGALGFMGPLPRPFLLACALGWSAIALIVTRLGLVRGPMMLGSSTRSLAVAASAIGPLVIGWVQTLFYAMQPPCVAPAPRVHLVCCVIGIAFATGPLAAMLWVRRGSDPVHPAATGAAIGAAAGAWGGLLIHLHCPYADPVHTVIGHVLPIVLLAALGAILGRRLLAVR